ncbi:class I adenylate-forming enzyme family protein [Arthrobacter sp. FW306-04-A]|uniref:class I adenylate-forming enzyme family protein n=1 Tax=Arthrobacter sp. FW306-04-A TaxID=2879619 RepID=UPI0037C10AA5|nr:acyl--CoA ligase [Arthrobacter sp. FW306-04-A]
MSTAIDEWGGNVGVVDMEGVPFRMYTNRPQHLGSLLAFANRWDHRPHIVQGERVVSFSDLRSAIAAQATDLRRLGIRAGDRVMILGWNSAEWITNFWASVAAGAVPVLANAWWSPNELEDALDRIAPSLVLADERNAKRIPAGWETGSWTAPADGSSEVETSVAKGDENEPAVIIFTSGTERRPKAVVLSHRSLLAGLQMLLHITKRLPQQIGEETGEAALHTGPMFHIGGVQTLLRAITVGDTLVMPSGRFDPEEALRLIEEWKIRRWSAVPTMVSRLLEHPDVQTRNLRSLRSLTVGGAPVHAEFLERIRTGLPGVEPRIATGYGLTENGGQAVAASGKDTTDRPGTTGKPLPCVEISIAPAADFDAGEILVRSPTQMSGYIGEEESPIDSEGWLHTGDLGHLDEDGYLWITGRSKDMIIRGGENIAPSAVEAVLAQLPMVSESVVFGVPHPDLGEEVMAIVVAPGATADELRAGLHGRLASFAVPSRWNIRTEPLPLNHAGKIDRATLVAEGRAEVVSTGGAGI